jgi:hypothetical protein
MGTLSDFDFELSPLGKFYERIFLFGKILIENFAAQTRPLEFRFVYLSKLQFWNLHQLLIDNGAEIARLLVITRRLVRLWSLVNTRGMEVNLKAVDVSGQMLLEAKLQKMMVVFQMDWYLMTK